MLSFCIDMCTFFINVGDLAPVVKLVDKETILKERAAKLAVSFFLTFCFL